MRFNNKRYIFRAFSMWGGEKNVILSSGDKNRGGYGGITRGKYLGVLD